MASFRFFAASHPGSVRDHNEDSYAFGERLAVIADGVGGHAAGEVASALVVKAFDELRAATGPVREPQRRLREAVTAANEAIAADSAANPEHEGMGSTVTALLFGDETVNLVHAGDSRAYRFRGGELRRMTRDDSYVQMLVDDGVIAEDEVATHPYRSVVTKALLGEPVDPSVSRSLIEPGDRYLICSDGLSDVVSEDDIADVLRDVADGDDACEALIRRTLAAGAPDNVTVVIVDPAAD